MSPYLETAIIKTLAYADLFDQALSTEELQRYLVGAEASVAQLRELKDSTEAIELHGDLWALKGRRELIELRLPYLAAINQKLQTLKRLLWVFRLLPWVKMVAVTGSVAGGSPNLDDDIDVLIVTQKSRLWLSRFLLVGFLSLLGKRRKPGDDPHAVNNKFCLNMWLSEENLPTTQQDIYVANELAHMVPVLNRHTTYERYIMANGWIAKVLPNFFYSIQNSELRIKKQADGLRSLDWLDAQLEQWQLRYMRARTKETVSQKLLMFHPMDYRGEILSRYQARLRTMGLEAIETSKVKK